MNLGSTYAHMQTFRGQPQNPAVNPKRTMPFTGSLIDLSIRISFGQDVFACQ